MMVLKVLYFIASDIFFSNYTNIVRKAPHFTKNCDVKGEVTQEWSSRIRILPLGISPKKQMNDWTMWVGLL